MFVTPVLAVCRNQIFGRLVTHQPVNLNETVQKILETRPLPSRGEHKFKKLRWNFQIKSNILHHSAVTII